MNEFEKYPELAEQMQEYASFGRFGNWQKFTDVLNETLMQVNQSDHLVNFLLHLNSKGLINNHDFDYNKEAKKYCEKIKEIKSI
ncbi:MAG: hypothetical protein WBK20_00910 [Spirochaetota bacterium]